MNTPKLYIWTYKAKVQGGRGFIRGVRKENINAAKRLWRKLKDIGNEITFEEFEVA